MKRLQRRKMDKSTSAVQSSQEAENLSKPTTPSESSSGEPSPSLIELRAENESLRKKLPNLIELRAENESLRKKLESYSGELSPNLIELRAEKESLRKKLAEMSQLLAQDRDNLCVLNSRKLLEHHYRLEAVLNDHQSLGQRVEHLEVLMEQAFIANPNIPR